MNAPNGPADAFFAELREGAIDVVGGWLDRDPGLIDAFDPNPWCCRATPLNVAVSRGDAALARLLLERGADPNRKSDWWAGGFGALHTLRIQDRDVLLPLLLEAGAVIDEHAAARFALVEELMAILDRWPMRVDAPGGDGARPLHFAADPAVAELLLERGAWIEAVDVDHGSTPAQWAVRERSDVTRFLLTRGAVADPFMLASLNEVDAVRQALDDAPDLISDRITPLRFPSPGSQAGHMYNFILGGYGSTMLHVAARSGAMATLRCLIDRGADLDALGGAGNPAPLHAAACYDRVDAVRALVEAGADINRLSGHPHHSSPLVWARACGAPRAEQVLLELGATATEESGTREGPR